MVRDYTGIAKALMGEYEKTKQPLKERATILPFGQYEDGSVGLAFPQILAAPAEGMVNFGRYGYDSPEAIRDNAMSAFDVAGGAVTGGLGVGLAGGMADNALGSAGGRLAQPQISKNLAGRDVYDFGGGTQVTMKDWPSGGRMVDNVYTDPQARGQGQARQAMEYILAEADQAGTPLKLAVSPGDMTTDAQRLQQFYEGLGFDYLGGGYMSRDPRANAPSGSSVPLAMNALERSQPQGQLTALRDRYRALNDEHNGIEGRPLVNEAAEADRLERLQREMAVVKRRAERILGKMSDDDFDAAFQSGLAPENYYANAPTGAAVPLASETQDQDPALIEYLRSMGLM